MEWHGTNNTDGSNLSVPNPDPQSQFLQDLQKFLTELKQEVAEYVLSWDANSPYDDEEIIDFLQETDMIDTFDNFLEDWPATHKNGSKQIDQISMSC
jgi:hypothetical protein